MAFIDPTKAFDTEPSSPLAGSGRNGLPRQIHPGTEASAWQHFTTELSGDGNEMEPFRVDTGVKQGHIIAPKLSSTLWLNICLTELKSVQSTQVTS